MKIIKSDFLTKAIPVLTLLFIISFSSKQIATGQAFLPFFSYFAVVLSISILVKPNIAMLIYFVGIPLTQMPLISGRLFGMPGLSVINIMCGIVLMIFVLHVKHSVRLDAAFKRTAILFWMVIIISIAFSSLHINELRIFWPEVTTYSYFRDNLVRPFVVWISFLLIIYTVRTNEDFLILLRYVFLSIIVSSALILAANCYFFARGHSYVAVRSLVGDFIGIHANDYGVMFTLAIPMILGSISLPIVTRGIRFLGIFAIIGAFLTVLFSYSRACYVAALLSVLSFSTIGIKKYLVILIPLIIFAPWIIPDSVKDRAQYGFFKGGSFYYHGSTTDYISAGRVSTWIHLFSELKNSQKQMLIGNGRHSTNRSQVRKLGIIKVGHPHNAYLEVLLDTGIIGGAVFLLFYGYLFRNVLREYRLSKNTPYEKFYLGGLIMFLSYLLLCLFGRTFFPGARFVFFWLMLGLLFAFSKITLPGYSALFLKTKNSSRLPFE